MNTVRGRWTRRSALGLLAAAPLSACAAPAAVSAALSTAASSTAALAATSPPRNLLPGGEFDTTIAGLAARDEFSGTVLLTYQGRPMLSRAHGLADRARGIPNRPDTIFALASVGKPFTGAAVVRLAAQQRIDFSATIGAYLDGFPAAIADTVTVHQLLTHTSGLGDYMSTAEWQRDAPNYTSAAEEFAAALAIIRSAPLLFTPGTSYSYSNSGYVTLGAIIAQVSGLSYYDYIRQHIFAPAGMTTADFYAKPQRSTDPRIAHPYATQPDGSRLDVTAQEPYLGTPSGDACASAADLAAFGHALATGALLGPAFTGLMTGGKTPIPHGPFQAYGILDAIGDNHRILLHGGGSPGESTNISIYPDLGWVAVLLCNYDVDLQPILRLQDALITGQT